MIQVKNNYTPGIILSALVVLLFSWTTVFGQSGYERQHRRGNLWENITNDGVIGSMAAWDFQTSVPMGLYPGFRGYTHPVGNEFDAIGTYANANFHNFRSGLWIMVKDMTVPSPPPKYNPKKVDYELYLSGYQGDPYGVLSERKPLEFSENYIENEGFNPLLPEEMIYGEWHTNTGISVTRRSYVWSYPSYDDFIIYDYKLKNTGKIVSLEGDTLIENIASQTLSDVFFLFHSAISVSTKSQINFYDALGAVAAGAFGWKAEAYHDFYGIDMNNELVYSYNYNGGKAPTPWGAAEYDVKENEIWKQKFGDELQSPAAFGWLALYASPTNGTDRSSPAPDVLRVDVHKGGTFNGQDLDLEKFTPLERPKKDFHDFAQTPTVQEDWGNDGNRMNMYSLSYGPYTLDPGDSVRFIVAEIAGVMDYNQVIQGDTSGWFPDSTIAAIRRNAEFAKQAVQWGRGATVDGMPLAADVPEPPPGPSCSAVNASVGSETPIIAVTWDKTAETKTITDNSGSVFYDGATDLDGYRIYRSRDFQYVSETQAPVLRGAAWTCIDTIPASEAASYWDPDQGKYFYEDADVEFGNRYGYYVSAYDSDPNSWTSANGEVVTDLPELESGSYNRTPPTSATPGPVYEFDIYAAPNPYIYNQQDRSFGLSDPYKIEFRNLPDRCTIRIYTLAGDLIRTLVHKPDAIGNLTGSESWDQKSESGLLVAPGLYIYHVENQSDQVSKDELTGKLMIIR